MTPYPLDFGPHTDPKNDTDKSASADSSPMTERYPLEFGAHLDQANGPPPNLPVFIPAMPTLLGGADSSFPHVSGVTPVNWPGDVAPSRDSQQLAQAQQTQKSSPTGRDERDRRATAAKQELNALAAMSMRQEDRKETIPADWERRLQRPTLDALNASAAHYGVPRELLARILWQESDFREDAGVAERNSGQGIAGMTEGAIAELKRLASARGDFARLKELQGLDRLKGPDAVNLASEYLRHSYDVNGKNWASAVAGYNAGPYGVRDWQNGTNDDITRAIWWPYVKPYLRYVFQGDPGRFDRKSFPEVP